MFERVSISLRSLLLIQQENHSNHLEHRYTISRHPSLSVMSGYVTSCVRFGQYAEHHRRKSEEKVRPCLSVQLLVCGEITSKRARVRKPRHVTALEIVRVLCRSIVSYNKNTLFSNSGTRSRLDHIEATQIYRI